MSTVLKKIDLVSGQPPPPAADFNEGYGSLML